MFKHILLPTDGSPLSDAAVQKGMRFAKSVGAQVTGLYVIPPYRLLGGGKESLADSKAQYDKDSSARAQGFLAEISNLGKELGVTCDCVSEKGSHPYEAIVGAAEKKGCDLIMMASHGRHGVQALLIGSETNKVLTHTKIPVLVFR
ncbi:MAG TPA: universal stress protein [Myxococcaceae bacterium]|nr:universal stress protein [Myxococcaceae bacterium]